MDLRDYEHDRFAIADNLRSASVIGPKEERWIESTPFAIERVVSFGDLMNDTGDLSTA